MAEEVIVRSLAVRRLAAIAVTTCGILWGWLWYPLRWLDAQGAGSGWVNFIFFAITCLSALPFVPWRGLRSGNFGGQLVAGTLMGTAFSLYTISLVTTEVVHAILLFYLTPVWSTIAGAAIFGERLTPQRAAAIVLGFSGMVAIFGFGSELPVPQRAGDWVALASGMLWAAGTLKAYNRPTASLALPVFTFALGGLLSSGAILAAAMALGNPLAATANLIPSLPLILALGFAVFVGPNYLVLWAAQRIDPARVGILLMTEVLSGTVTAALFSGESLGAKEVAGTAMIVCAGLIEILARR